MNYEEFRDYLEKELSELMGEGYSVKLNHLTACNGRIREALCIQAEDERITPILYLDDYFEEFKGGTPVDQILAQMIKVYTETVRPACSIELLEDWSFVSGKLCARLIATAGNREYLRDLPHREILDMSLIYFILLDGTEEKSGSIVVHNGNMQIWGVDEAELYARSRENLPALLPACIFSLEEMLTEMLLGTAPHTDLLSEDPVDDTEGAGGELMYVLTNSARYHGAVTMMYEGVLDRFMERMQWDSVYLIPSSIHEMLILSAEFEEREEKLLDMVYEVNDTVVSSEDRLTYSIYRCEKGQQIRLIAGGERT